MTPEQATKELGTKIVGNMMSTLQVAEKVVEQAFLEIVVGLLPILADLLSQNCKPDSQAELAELINHPGLRGKLFRWRFRREAQARIQDNDMWNEWGNVLVQSTLDIAANDENAELVTTAMIAKPKPPVWGIFNSGNVLTGLVVLVLVGGALSAPSEAQCVNCGFVGSTSTQGWSQPVSAPVFNGYNSTVHNYPATRTYVSNSVPAPRVVYRTYSQPIPRIAYYSSVAPRTHWSNSQTPVRSFVAGVANACASVGGSIFG